MEHSDSPGTELASVSVSARLHTCHKHCSCRCRGWGPRPCYTRSPPTGTHNPPCTQSRTQSPCSTPPRPWQWRITRYIKIQTLWTRLLLVESAALLLILSGALILVDLGALLSLVGLTLFLVLSAAPGHLDVGAHLALCLYVLGVPHHLTLCPAPRWLLSWSSRWRLLSTGLTILWSREHWRQQEKW